MEIQSAFNTGLQGFQKASESAYKAAENIATTVGITSESYGIGGQSSNQISSTESLNSNTKASLTESVVNLRVAEFQAKASAKVIESADENLGTLLDVRV